MKKVLSIAVPILACFLVGWAASYYQSDALENWYPYLNKPALTPPDIVFPIAWNILYVCMGVSIGLILISCSTRKPIFLIVFGLQLLLNFMWSIIFFYMRNPLIGLMDILLLDAMVVYYILITFKTHRISSILFFPYILWLAFATYLNAYIVMYN